MVQRKLAVGVSEDRINLVTEELMRSVKFAGKSSRMPAAYRKLSPVLVRFLPHVTVSVSQANQFFRILTFAVGRGLNLVDALKKALFAECPNAGDNDFRELVSRPMV
jgi:hypothetical protein